LARIADLLNSPATVGIATGSALGGFIGASIAFLTGREDKMDLYIGRGAAAGGYAALCYEIAKAITRTVGPASDVKSGS